MGGVYLANWTRGDGRDNTKRYAKNERERKQWLRVTSKRPGSDSALVHGHGTTRAILASLGTILVSTIYL